MYTYDHGEDLYGVGHHGRGVVSRVASVGEDRFGSKDIQVDKHSKSEEWVSIKVGLQSASCNLQSRHFVHCLVYILSDQGSKGSSMLSTCVYAQHKQAKAADSEPKTRGTRLGTGDSPLGCLMRIGSCHLVNWNSDHCKQHLQSAAYPQQLKSQQ